jgi:hypothetical protein
MTTSPKRFEVDGQHFGSAAQSGRTNSAPELPDPRMAVLTKLRMNCKSEEIDALNELLLARQEQNEELDRLFQRWRSDIFTNLGRDHETAKEAVRTQLERIDQAQGEIDKLQGQLNDLAQDVFKRESALATAREHLHALSPYSPKSAVRKAEESLRVAEARLEQIQSTSGTIENQQRQIVLVTLPQLKQELQRLTSQERAAASAISGEPYHDESGLILPPGSTF